MNIKCPECGKVYRLDSKRIPAAGATVKCKQCDYAIKVLPEVKRVVVCPECTKQYRIAESRIPPTLKAIECKGCRGTIPLVKTPEPEDVVSSSDDVSEDEKAVSQTGLFQQRWFWVAGAVAAVLLLCVCLWVGLYLPKQEGRLSGASDAAVSQEPAENEISEQVSATDHVAQAQAFADDVSSRATAVTPVAAITLRVPALLRAVQNSTYLDKLPPAAQMVMMSLATTGLGSIDLIVCQDEAGRLWPVLRVENPPIPLLTGFMGQGGAMADYFIQKDESTYQLNEPLIAGILFQMLVERAPEGTAVPTEEELSGVPFEAYAVVLEGRQGLLVPDCVRSALKHSPDLLEQARLVQWMTSMTHDRDLLRVCASMPSDIHETWSSRVIENEWVQAHPQAGLDMWVTMFGTQVTTLLKSLSQLEQVALTLSCPSFDQRRLTWGQQFREGALAQQVYEQVKTGQMEGLLEGHPLRLLISGIMTTPEIQCAPVLSQQLLNLTFTWSEADDLAILNGLGTPSQGDEPDALNSAETFEEADINVSGVSNDRVESLLFAAGLTRDLDEPLWRETLAHRFAQALTPSSSDAFGIKGAKYLDVELWGDNATLASVFYEETQVMSPEGKPQTGSVARREPMVGQRIRVPVPKGAQASEAVIQFDVSVPCHLDAAVLDVSPGVAVNRDMVTGSVTMAKVADQAVRLTYNKMSMPVVYAFDRLGNRLRRDRISREKDGVYLYFGGQVETCLVVSVLDRVNKTFETCVTLDPGDAKTLSYEPEVPKYTRFDQTPLVNYATVSSLDVNDLVVHWQQERQQSHFSQVLSVDLPENVAVQSNWEVYAHRWDRKVRLTGASVPDNQRVAYECRLGGSRTVDQLSGSVQLYVSSKIERVTLSLEELSHMCCVEMPSGKYLDVSLDKNRLSYMVLGGDVLQVAAYDAQGRRLKQDPAWRFRQDMKEVYFWGVPAQVVLDVSTQAKMARLDFSVTEPSPTERQPRYTTSLPRRLSENRTGFERPF